MQCLKDAYKGIESGRVSEHCCVLIHLQDHWTFHEQGEPLGQQAVSVGPTVIRSELLKLHSLSHFKFQFLIQFSFKKMLVSVWFDYFYSLL